MRIVLATWRIEVPNSIPTNDIFMENTRYIFTIILRYSTTSITCLQKLIVFTLTAHWFLGIVTIIYFKLICIVLSDLDGIVSVFNNRWRSVSVWIYLTIIFITIDSWCVLVLVLSYHATSKSTSRKNPINVVIILLLTMILFNSFTVIFTNQPFRWRYLQLLRLIWI